MDLSAEKSDKAPGETLREGRDFTWSPALHPALWSAMASTHQEHGRQRSVSGALTVGEPQRQPGWVLAGPVEVGVSGCLS